MPTVDEHRTHQSTVDPIDLRARGRRLTPQRRLIWDVLSAAGDLHLSGEDLGARVQAQMPSLNKSTVHRNLELLIDEGLVLRTNLGGDRAY